MQVVHKQQVERRVPVAQMARWVTEVISVPAQPMQAAAAAAVIMVVDLEVWAQQLMQQAVVADLHSHRQRQLKSSTIRAIIS
jgi:hypothetical protein